MSLLAFAASVCPAESLRLVVSNETAPAGAAVQIKVYAAEPRRISTGYIDLRLDSAYFEIARTIAAFSSTGDAMGIGGSFESPSSGIGQLPELPVLAVTATLKPGIPPGTEIPVVVERLEAQVSPLSANKLRWHDAEGAPYEVSATPGMVRIGGTLSIREVIPGAGLLPAGTVVFIDGTGFEAKDTGVTIDGAALRDTFVLSPERIAVVLAGAIEMTGRRVRVRNSAGESVDFFPSFPTAGNVIVPLIERRSGQGGSTTDRATHVILNPGQDSVEIQWQSRGPNREPVYGKSIIPAGGQLRIVPQEVDPTAFVASAPVRSVVHHQFYRPSVRDWVTAPLPVAALPPLALKHVAGIGLDWDTHRGDRDLRGAISIWGFGRVRLSKPAAASWLTLESSELELSGSTASVPVRARTAGLAAGVYTAEITISPVPPSPDVPVRPEFVRATLTITEQPELRIAGGPVSLCPSAPPSTATAVVQILSNGDPVRFTARIEGANWLTVTPTESVAPGSVTLVADAAKVIPGLYQARLVVSGIANSVSQEIRVRVGTAERAFKPTPEWVFATALIGAPPQTHTLYLPQQPIPETQITYSSGSGWLLVTPGPVWGASNTLNFRLDPSGLRPGDYRASVLPAAPGYTPVSVPVTLAVMAPPTTTAALRADRSELTFVIPAGGKSSPQSVRITVAEGVEYIKSAGSRDPVTVSFSGLFTPQGYTTPLSVDLTASASVPGVYTGALEVWGVNSSVRVPWKVIVTASEWSPPLIANLVNAASQGPGPLVPGAIYSLYGSGIGGGASLDLRIDGQPATVLYHTPSQVNFIASETLRDGTVARLELITDNLRARAWELPVAAAAPAIFTADSTGRAAPAGVSSPVPRGSIIRLLLTGGSPSRVTIGGREAALLGTYTAEGATSIDVRVPEDLEPGSHPVVVSAGDAQSQAGVWITVAN